MVPDPGINLAFAALLLSRGCNVVLADLALCPKAHELVDLFSDPDSVSWEPPARAVYVETDVQSWPALDRMFDVAEKEFGGFDIVCPGAGVYEPLWSNFWHPPESSARSRDRADGGGYGVLDTNLLHPIRTTQVALGRWLDSGSGSDAHASSGTGSGGGGGGGVGGETQEKKEKKRVATPKRVVHISSIAAQISLLSTPLYAASKAGLSAFVRSLGPLEDEVGVRVNAAAPGIVRTPLWLENPEKLQFVDESKGDVWVTAEEVADAMLSLVEDGDMVGGTVLEVGRAHRRVVQVYGDPGPDTKVESGKGLGASGAGRGNEDALG